MSLFRRTNSLHQRHAAAHAVSQNALSVFHVIAEDLELSANEHRDVAATANDQANVLADLRDDAYQAALDADLRALAVRKLVA